MRQAQAPGHQRGEEGTELLVGRDDPVQARAAVAGDDLVDEPQRVEGEEPRVIREAEEVEALVVEFVAPAVARVARGEQVPLVGEEDEDAPRALRPAQDSASAQMLAAQFIV